MWQCVAAGSWEEPKRERERWKLEAVIYGNKELHIRFARALHSSPLFISNKSFSRLAILFLYCFIFSILCFHHIQFVTLLAIFAFWLDSYSNTQMRSSLLWAMLKVMMKIDCYCSQIFMKLSKKFSAQKPFIWFFRLHDFRSPKKSPPTCGNCHALSLPYVFPPVSLLLNSPQPNVAGHK